MAVQRYLIVSLVFGRNILCYFVRKILVGTSCATCRATAYPCLFLYHALLVRFCISLFVSFCATCIATGYPRDFYISLLIVVFDKLTKNSYSYYINLKLLIYFLLDWLLQIFRQIFQICCYSRIWF